MPTASSPLHPRVTGWAGTTTTPTCTTAASASSGPGYNAHLVAEWLPAVDGLVDKLESGATVADIGCGHGASTVLMAQAYPASRFVGSDYHAASIGTAVERAAEAGVADRIDFEVAPASSFSGSGYDLVTTFDALHDMGDPVGAAKRVHEALAPDGVWLLVEPAAGDRVEDNLNPVGRAFYGFSTLLCTPASLSQPVGAALGTQAGPARIRDVTVAAGFRSFRLAAVHPVQQRVRGAAVTWPAWTRPVREDVVVRGGTRISFAVHGSGPATVVLLPAWSIVRSRMWKAQVPHLARHHRVVTFDGRGSGGSDRPEGAAAYSNAEYAADTVAVLDAVGVDRAVLVGLSSGAAWAAQVAAEHPDRVQGLVAIGPVCGSWQPRGQADLATYTDPQEDTQGWAKYNRHHWLEGGYDDFVEFFFAQMFHEPHSTRQREEGSTWAHELAPQTLVDCTSGRLGLDGAEVTELGPLLDAVRCPVLVLHGSEDRVRAVDDGVRFASRSGGSLVVLEGCGHGPPMRDPVVVNHEIDRFVARVTGGPDAVPPPTAGGAPAAPGPARHPQRTRPPRRGAGRGRCDGSARCSCCPHRSGWATPGVTWRSSRRCGSSTPTCGCAGWPRTR